MNYFENEDILHVLISEEPETNSVEISPDITVEMNDMGKVVGVEIRNASQFIRDFVLESVQGKLFPLNKRCKPCEGYP